MKKVWWMALLILLVPVVAAAQPARGVPAEANPVSTAVRNILAYQSKNLIASIEEMPAEKFNFRPTPAQMTFGHLAMHITGSNYYLCSKVSGEAAPPAPKLTEHSPKSELVAAVKGSFDFCASALERVDDSHLTDMVPFFGGRQVTRAMGLISINVDLADHYAMAAIYLRLNGLLPPTAQAHGKGKE
jgi:DinB superfamily